MSGRPVAFGYRGVARVVEPWRLLSRHGAWYLIGYDRTRGAGREPQAATASRATT